MDVMTHAEFHFNRLMLSFIFGVWASEPPPPPPPPFEPRELATEKTWPDRVKVMSHFTSFYDDFQRYNVTFKARD